jgi:hypothetical protein
VAVFDFESKDEAVRDLGPKVATLVNASLSADPDVITVERAELDKALGEQEAGLSGTISPDTAAKVGQLTGAQVLVTGRVFKADEQTIIVAKIIGTETSRVYGEMVTGKPGALITDLSAELAKKNRGRRGPKRRHADGPGGIARGARGQNQTAARGQKTAGGLGEDFRTAFWAAGH